MEYGELYAMEDYSMMLRILFVLNLDIKDLVSPKYWCILTDIAKPYQ